MNIKGFRLAICKRGHPRGAARKENDRGCHQCENLLARERRAAKPKTPRITYQFNCAKCDKTVRAQLPKSGVKGRYCSKRCYDQVFRKLNLEQIRQLKAVSYKRGAKIIRDYHLRMNFGISLTDFNRMLLLQNQRCGICDVHQDQCKKSFAVDHEHGTRIVRGLVCDRCNSGMGMFCDSAELCQKAADYIKKKGVLYVTSK